MREDLIYILSFLPGFTSDMLSKLSAMELRTIYQEYQDSLEDL